MGGSIPQTSFHILPSGFARGSSYFNWRSLGRETALRLNFRRSGSAQKYSKWRDVRLNLLTQFTPNVSYHLIQLTIFSRRFRATHHSAAHSSEIRTNMLPDGLSKSD